MTSYPACFILFTTPIFIFFCTCCGRFFGLLRRSNTLPPVRGNGPAAGISNAGDCGAEDAEIIARDDADRDGIALAADDVDADVDAAAAAAAADVAVLVGLAEDGVAAVRAAPGVGPGVTAVRFAVSVAGLRADAEDAADAAEAGLAPPRAALDSVAAVTCDFAGLGAAAVAVADLVVAGATAAADDDVAARDGPACCCCCCLPVSAATSAASAASADGVAERRPGMRDTGMEEDCEGARPAVADDADRALGMADAKATGFGLVASSSGKTSADASCAKAPGGGNPSAPPPGAPTAPAAATPPWERLRPDADVGRLL